MNLAQRRLLVDLYNNQPLVVDALHHTTEFSALCVAFNAEQAVGFTQHDIYAELLRLRKSKQLPRKTTIRPRKLRIKKSAGFIQGNFLG